MSFPPRWGKVLGRGSGLDGSLSVGEEGERMTSSTSGGVLVDDGASEGEGGKKERSFSKFRNSVQLASKVGGVVCNSSSPGISNRVDRLSVVKATSVGAFVDVSTTRTGIKKGRFTWNRGNDARWERRRVKKVEVK